MLDLLKRWWPSILLALTALWGVFGTGIQHAISANPKLTAVLGAVAGILAHLLASPLNPSPTMMARVKRLAQAGIVCILMVCLVACTTPTWVKDAEADLPEVLNILVEVLPLISAATGSAVPTQVETDIQLAESLYAAYKKNPSPSLLPGLQNAVAAAQADINQILASLHIADANTQKTIIASLGVAAAVLAAIASNIPVAPTTALAAKTSVVKLRVPKPAEVRASFNAIIAAGGHPELQLSH